jgi:hypothetical protein
MSRPSQPGDGHCQLQVYDPDCFAVATNSGLSPSDFDSPSPYSQFPAEPAAGRGRLGLGSGGSDRVARIG